MENIKEEVNSIIINSVDELVLTLNKIGEEEVIKVTEEKVDVEKEDIVPQTMSMQEINEVLEKSNLKNDEPLILEVEEIKHNSYHRYAKGDVVWYPKYEGKTEMNINTVMRTIFKYRPLKATVREVCIEGKDIYYRFFKLQDRMEEALVKSNFIDCENLCNGLNK